MLELPTSKIVSNHKPAELKITLNPEQPKNALPTKMFYDNLMTIPTCEPKLAKLHQSNGKKANYVTTKIKLQFKPSNKTFKEEEDLAAAPKLDLIKMNQVGSIAEPQSRRFLCIRELEFPHLYKNPVVQ